MRPIGTIVYCFIALTASVATAQTGESPYPAPTIHNSGQRAIAVPLPSLSGADASLPNHASNASWVSDRTNVAQASYVAAAPATEPTKQATSTRTPLNPPKAEPTAVDHRSSSGNTVRMLLSVGSSLLIVLGLFLGVAWCYRKTLNTTMGSIPKQVVSVLGRTAIAPRQQLVLVRFGSKLVLVSLIQGEARAISEITDPLEVDQLAGACESHQPHSLTNSFRSLLNQNGGGAL